MAKRRQYYTMVDWEAKHQFKNESETIIIFLKPIWLTVIQVVNYINNSR